jgi:16S rRNA (adenine1518-N6/adenine1519-N6)-dimethyltransferase
VSAPPPRSARQRALGQNFLVDPNTLDVIARLADVTARDVVLEVGGGPGVLSQRLARSARFVHVIEIDERLRDTLTGALAAFDNVAVRFDDALALDLTTLMPAPTKVVANLPYGIAATVVLRTVLELPTVSSWLVMVQREVGERLAAAPGSPAYGAPSVLAQLACEVRVLRAVPRTVFRPMPNVDSVLVGLTRVAPAPPDHVRHLVRDAFAHRRKALARSLALAPGAADGVREAARTALVELGLPADARAERLTPTQFVELAERLR